MRAVCCLLHVLLVVGGTAAIAHAAESAPASNVVDQLQDTLAHVADAVGPSVVAIRAERKLDEDDFDEKVPDDEVHRALKEKRIPAAGTGVLISAVGDILTNEHVVHNARPEDIEVVLSDGRTYRVEGFTSDPRSDLAVLRIDASGLRPARLGDSDRARQGHFVLVMGNPFGTAFENSGRSAMTFGIVSALGLDLTQKLDLSQQRYYGNLIQTDARINPGNSGGPLINLRGEVIGITTAISTRSGANEGVGYAIAVDERVKQIIEHLRKGEDVEYGFLGIQLDRPTDEQRRSAGAPPQGGALIRDVTSGAPAAGKLEPGDIVVEFNKRQVQDVDQLIRLVGGAAVGKRAEVKLYRASRTLVVEVTPARKNVLKGVHAEAPLIWRGMKLADVSPELRDTFKLADDVAGVVVTQVDADSQAARAGFKPGALIERVGSTAVTELRSLRRILPHLSGPVRIRTAGSTAELTLP